MRRTNQASRKYYKIGIILVLCFCAWQALSAAIVLETPQTEVKIFVTDRKEERNKTSPSSQTFPLCSIAIMAKHYGKGYLNISYTPLINGVDVVAYLLFSEDSQEILPDVLSYRGNPHLPLTIPLAKLYVMLAKPLPGARSSYSSDVILHLKLEK